MIFMHVIYNRMVCLFKQFAILNYVLQVYNWTKDDSNNLQHSVSPLQIMAHHTHLQGLYCNIFKSKSSTNTASSKCIPFLFNKYAILCGLSFLWNFNSPYSLPSSSLPYLHVKELLIFLSCSCKIRGNSSQIFFKQGKMCQIPWNIFLFVGLE